MKTKNLAFTLAETLVVMGIIGVIAALTIPNLSQSTGNREKVTKVKKAYATFGEAFERATAIYGPADEWFTSDMSELDNATRFGERMIEFMKISKNCKNGSGCLPSHSSVDSNTEAFYKVITADGTSVCFANYQSIASNTNFQGDLTGQSAYPLQVNIDIDGTKGKCEWGKDCFSFVFIKNIGIRPHGDQYTPAYIMTNLKTGDKTLATSWVLKFDNMDYLKTDDNWKCTTGSGKVLNITANPPVTSCN